MKNKFFIYKAIAFVLLLSISFVSCQKDENDDKEDTQESIQSAKDNSMVETEFSAVFDAADDVAAVNHSGSQLKGHGYTILPSGAEVIYTDSIFGDDGDGVEFYIDYGEMGSDTPYGLLCKDGRYRSGRIDVSITDRYYVENSVLTISIPASNEYHVGNGTDMTHITGTKEITRNDSVTRSIKVTGASATNDEGTISWSAERVIKRTYNDGILGLWGDEFTITGSAKGTNINGVDFTAAISDEKPLIKTLKMGCARTFISGVITINNENGGELILDYDPYDDQACDKVAEVSIGDNSWIIIVR